MLLGLAWRNLWRRPQRTLLSLTSIAIVAGLLAFMLSFQIGVYDTLKVATLRIFDGYAQLQPKGWADDPGIEHVIADPAKVAERAVAVRGVGVAAPRVNAFAVLANGDRSYAAAVIGVDPARETKVSSIAGLVRQGRYLQPGDTDSAVIGEVLARNLGVGVGGKVTLLGAGQDGSVAADVLKVSGIYKSGIAELDRSILEMPLARAQDTFAMPGAANTIALGGPSLGDVNAALPALRAIAAGHGVAARGWTELEPALADGITLKYAASMMFYVTLVVVVVFIILNTLLMSVLERTREFGTLLALGMKPDLIGAMVWLELLILALGGCAVGLALGGGIAGWLAAVGIDMSGLGPNMGSVMAQYGLPSRLYPAVTAFSLLAGPGAILTAIVLGGIVPYLRVVRMTAASAMRAP